MTEPACEVCLRALRDESDPPAGVRCACRACGGLHRCCLWCARLFGRERPFTFAGRLHRSDEAVWADVDLCPADARATAALAGIRLGLLGIEAAEQQARFRGRGAEA